MGDGTQLALVPQDQPYGARKQLVEDRRAAGLPLGASVGQRPGGAPSSNPQPPPDMLRVAQPTRTPDLASILNPPQIDPHIQVRQMRDAAQNIVVRELLSRMIGE